jgi:hypothetical protein
VSRSGSGSSLHGIQAHCQSKTRPAYLPPKTPEEELKHQAEYARICEQVAAAEKKREAKRRAYEEARASQRHRDEIEWKTKVLPDLDHAKALPKTRELWWRGVPTQLREYVWKAQIGNKLGIAPDAFPTLSKKPISGSSVKILNGDACRVFPELQIFGHSGPLHEDLLSVVTACTHYTNTPYKPQLCHIAAVLLLNMAAPDAFVAMCNLLNGSLCRSILVREEKTVTCHYSSFLKVLNTKFTSLYRHFQSIHLPPSAYLEPMISTLFAAHLPVDVVMRAWDIYVFEGDAFLLRLALGIIASVEHRLYSDDVAGVLEHLGWGASVLKVSDEDAFFKRVRDILKPSV